MDAAEAPQTVPEPCLARSEYLWWGAMVHLQTPLENIGIGAFQQDQGKAAAGAAAAAAAAEGEGSNAVVILEMRDASKAGSKVRPSSASSRRSSNSSSEGKRGARLVGRSLAPPLLPWLSGPADVPSGSLAPLLLLLLLLLLAPPPQLAPGRSRSPAQDPTEGGAWGLLDVGKQTVDTKDGVQLEM